ncbi:hypothetical protein SDC9_39892 [bioreactor metagenome]|uniref:Uncharacterized protein n=1 Tax=bioreactor metagenome TaxID=1076179 RepID=A0A644VQU2_9ZZZZ
MTGGCSEGAASAEQIVRFASRPAAEMSRDFVLRKSDLFFAGSSADFLYGIRVEKRGKNRREGGVNPPARFGKGYDTALRPASYFPDSRIPLANQRFGRKAKPCSAETGPMDQSASAKGPKGPRHSQTFGLLS